MSALTATVRSEAPEYSVVVTDARDAESFARCVRAVQPQCERLGAELIVLAAEPASPLGVRRADGIDRAQGRWVLMTEPPCVPDGDWLERMVAAVGPSMNTSSPAVLGGAVGNARRERASDRAAYFAEYGIYGASDRVTLPDGTPHITAANVAYRRDILPMVSASYRTQAGEPFLHMALHADGWPFALVPAARVRYHGDLAFGAALADRFAHGREYGASEAHASGLRRRVFRSLVALLVVPVLVWRIGRAAEPEARRDFARTLPLLVVLLAGWSLGEAVGWLTGRQGRAA